SSPSSPRPLANRPLGLPHRGTRLAAGAFPGVTSTGQMVRPVVGEPPSPNGGIPLSPVRRERIPENIVSQIQQRLERGELKPGDQLPSERVLAEQLQVSRPSVREALRSLELLGVTESRPGGGTFMRIASPDALLRPLTALTRAHDIEDILEVRALLEPALAELAARRA